MKLIEFPISTSNEECIFKVRKKKDINSQRNDFRVEPSVGEKNGNFKTEITPELAQSYTFQHDNMGSFTNTRYISKTEQPSLDYEDINSNSHKRQKSQNMEKTETAHKHSKRKKNEINKYQAYKRKEELLQEMEKKMRMRGEDYPGNKNHFLKSLDSSLEANDFLNEKQIEEKFLKNSTKQHSPPPDSELLQNIASQIKQNTNYDRNLINETTSAFHKQIPLLHEYADYLSASGFNINPYKQQISSTLRETEKRIWEGCKIIKTLLEDRYFFKDNYCLSMIKYHKYKNKYRKLKALFQNKCAEDKKSEHEVKEGEREGLNALKKENSIIIAENQKLQKFLEHKELEFQNMERTLQNLKHSFTVLKEEKQIEEDNCLKAQEKTLKQVEDAEEYIDILESELRARDEGRRTGSQIETEREKEREVEESKEEGLIEEKERSTRRNMKSKSSHHIPKLRISQTQLGNQLREETKTQIWGNFTERVPSKESYTTQTFDQVNLSLLPRHSQPQQNRITTYSPSVKPFQQFQQLNIHPHTYRESQINMNDAPFTQTFQSNPLLFSSIQDLANTRDSKFLPYSQNSKHSHNSQNRQTPPASPPPFAKNQGLYGSSRPSLAYSPHNIGRILNQKELARSSQLNSLKSSLKFETVIFPPELEEPQTMDNKKEEKLKAERDQLQKTAELILEKMETNPEIKELVQNSYPSLKDLPNRIHDIFYLSTIHELLKTLLVVLQNLETQKIEKEKQQKAQEEMKKQTESVISQNISPAVAGSDGKILETLETDKLGSDTSQKSDSESFDAGNPEDVLMPFLELMQQKNKHQNQLVYTQLEQLIENKLKSKPKDIDQSQIKKEMENMKSEIVDEITKNLNNRLSQSQANHPQQNDKESVDLLNKIYSSIEHKNEKIIDFLKNRDKDEYDEFKNMQKSASDFHKIPTFTDEDSFVKIEQQEENVDVLPRIYQNTISSYIRYQESNQPRKRQSEKKFAFLSKKASPPKPALNKSITSGSLSMQRDSPSNNLRPSGSRDELKRLQLPKSSLNEEQLKTLSSYRTRINDPSAPRPPRRNPSSGSDKLLNKYSHPETSYLKRSQNPPPFNTSHTPTHSQNMHNYNPDRNKSISGSSSINQNPGFNAQTESDRLKRLEERNMIPSKIAYKRVGNTVQSYNVSGSGTYFPIKNKKSQLEFRGFSGLNPSVLKAKKEKMEEKVVVEEQKVEIDKDLSRRPFFIANKAININEEKIKQEIGKVRRGSTPCSSSFKPNVSIPTTPKLSENRSSPNNLDKLNEGSNSWKGLNDFFLGDDNDTQKVKITDNNLIAATKRIESHKDS